MTQFRKFSIIGGWVVFAITFLVYMLTLEPTASLWDCPEFIATSYKLEVGHPPGTPFFFLINRIGAMFAGSPVNVAYAINTLSALESALTIAFLFWSIAHLARKIMRKAASELSFNDVLVTMSAAAIGSLAYAFTDTFWFSAVEAEVYALSSLFTAVVFWAMLRWDSVADEKGNERWLIFIAYLMGLSIGAHILNLLTIPALVFVYYFRKYPEAPKAQLWKPAMVGVLLTGLCYMLTPTVVSIGAVIDRWFVNGMSLPVNSGMATLIVLILAGLAYGIYKTHKSNKLGLNTILVSVVMVVIGFSTYGVVLIRSGEHTPMDSNSPNNPYALKKFLNRDQYGAPPLISGYNFNSVPISYNEESGYYLTPEGKYESFDALKDLEYDPATTTLFPRMHAYQHAEEYKAWANFSGRKVKTARGDMVMIPTFGENLRFFLGYQVNHMYWRYFLWNFVGRQSDIQSDGPSNGGWLSGIGFVDEAFAGPQTDLPQEVEQNKGRNTYYFLPLILGMIGLFYSLKKDGRGFLVVMLLFFMTGLAIILYLNQTPSQPRERDYAYAGSFYAFCIWIGLGAMGLYDTIKKRFVKNNAKVAIAVATVLGLSVPTVLIAQNWDDHDRSHRTVARDMGYNYLIGTLPNSVFINYGDNDTFPVWYIQEVENVRTDVRIMNQSYIGGDWYIEQMKLKAYDGEALPLSLPRHKYLATKSSPTFDIKETPRPGGGFWTIQEVMQIINSDDKSTKTINKYSGELVDFIPSHTIAIPVNKANVLRSGIVGAQDAHLIEDTIYIKLTKSVGIGDMILLDLIANSDWTRPLYFSSSAGPADIGLITYNDKGEAYSYLQNDGAGYLFVPIKTPITKRYGAGRIDTERLYDNMINKYSYGGLKEGAYVDQFATNTMMGAQFRSTFARLADSLLSKGDTLRAIKVLDRAMEELPVPNMRRDEMLIGIAEGYWKAGLVDKGDAVALDLLDSDLEYAQYYSRFKGEQNKAALNDKLSDIYSNMTLLYRAALPYNRTVIIEELAPYFQQKIDEKE